MRVFVRLPGPADVELASRLRGRGWTVLGPGEIPEGWTLARTVDEIPSAGATWLRGLEAAGPVGDTTALVLIRAATRAGVPWVAEGLGPIAAAAAVASGAAGVVVDAALWLARGVSGLPDEVREALRRAESGRDTLLGGELDEARERVLARGRVRWPAPQSVAEAARHAGGDPVEIVEAVLAEIRERVALPAGDLLAADPLGTGRPIVQGPMANVSERTGLAVAVRRAGGMPFAALGALDPAQAGAVLDAWSADVERPWGVGVIGFDVMPWRDAHLQAVAAARPDAVLLAGGSAALATALAARGVSPWLHTPSGRLAAQALEAGVPAIVLEGHEAGGHVGALTSVGLWEEGLRAVEAHLDASGAPPLVVLAGGIGDEASAAFAAAMAAAAAGRGARVALQAGTAFFFTHEIVESGQITPTYQATALACRRTLLVGSTTNLPLRVPPSPYADEARALERDLATSDVPRTERRARLEHHNLGRTRIAARGIERAPAGDGRRYRPVALERQAREGAFTLGQGAAVADRLETVAALVERLTVGAAARLGAARPPPGRWGPAVVVPGAPRVPAHSARVAVAERAPTSGDVAVVGLGCVLPGALDVPAFWRLLIEGRDAVGPVDEERWGLASYFDPAAGHEGPTLTYARHAGVIRGFEFDPLRFRIPPSVLPTVDPSQRLALAASAEAVSRAGWDRKGRVDPTRAAVVLGNAMGGEFAKSTSLRIRFREVLEVLRRDELAAGWSASDLGALEARVEAALAERLPPVEVDSMAGLLSNVVAGRVASWLDWMGGNLTVDAACAASLAAVAVAVDWLRSGRCDAVLAGGVDTDLTPESYVGFSRTRALSPTGSSPFSRHADGFVMGEGAAVLALKRLEDALADGDAVWAVIRGVGQSSDGRGRGITAPRAEGQALALARAYADARLEPRDVGLLEAHGTGTALGDRTEVGVLARHLRDAPAPVWLGSVKSMIGHLKGAAGAAGLAKTVLALCAGVVPPTLHAGPVSPDLGIAGGPIRLPRGPVPLPPDRRRAGVSAFGFGGTNFHVVLEAPPPDARAPAETADLVDAAAPLLFDPSAAAWADDDATPLLLPYAAADLAGLARALADDACAPVEQAAAAPVRVVVVADPGERAARVERAARWLAGGAQGPPPPGCFLGRGEARPITLLFPGQGAQRPGAVTSLRGIAAGARALAAVEALLDGRPLDDAASSDPVALHATLFALGVAWASVLREARVPIAATAGHSLGAYAALVAAGAWRLEDAVGPVMARGQALSACPPGAMLAVRLDAPEAARVADAHGLVVAALNAPGSTVLAGPRSAVRAAADALGPAVARPLSVERAYHSPAVTAAARAVEAVLQAAPPGKGEVPVWSSRTARRVDDPATDLVRGIVEPVRFHDTVRAMVDAGLGPFVEVGPGATLSALASATGADALALDSSPADRGRGQVSAAAALLARGHAGLARALPGTVIEIALPAPSRRAPAAAPPAPSPGPRPPADLRRRASAVVDLRIAALAEPSLEPTYLQARAALVRDLALADAGTPTEAAPLVAPERQEAPAPSLPGPEPAPVDDVRGAVLAAICEVTGYPPEFVEDDADLEGDLGVDSIRKMEILGLLEQRLGFTTAEADYARLADADLGALVAHVRERLDAPVGEVAAAATGARSFVWALAPLESPPERSGPSATPWRCPPGLDPLAAVAAIPSDVEVAVLPEGDAGATACAAWLRSLAREQGRTIRIVRASADVDPDLLAAEVAARGRPPEVVVRADGPLVPAPLALQPAPAEPPMGAVWLVTGGTGIALECLVALAAARPRVALLGRRGPGDALERLRDAGIEATWVACDVTDAIAVREAVQRVRERFGRIDVVLHAAATLRDGAAADQKTEDRHAVWAPKVLGARHLIDATSADELALWCTFSSLVAHVGNPGQTAYAAANAALEALRHPRATRSLAVAWTAWSGVGMAADPALQRLLAARGVAALTPAAGAAAFRSLVASQVSGTVLVAAQDLPGRLVPAWPLAHATAAGGAPAFRIALDPDDPALKDHRVGGRPLVPAAVWLSALLEAARLATGRSGPWSVEDMAIDVPTFVDRPRDDVCITLTPAPPGWTATVRAGGAAVCRATIVACASPASAAPPQPLDEPESASALYRPDLLFHGPTWRVLQRIRSAEDGVSADLSPTGVAGAVDGAHQALCAWSDRANGWLGLPVGAARWVCDLEPDGPLRLEARAAASGRSLEADVTVVDGHGRVVLRGEGVRLEAATRSRDG